MKNYTRVVFTHDATRRFVFTLCLFAAMLPLLAQGQASPAPAGPVASPAVPGEPRSRADEATAIEITRAFYYDARIPSALTYVDVANGVATLTGTVPTQAAREAAKELASRTPGVTKVVDQLVVALPAPAHSDEEIYRNVRHAFGTDPQINRYPLHVGVLNGRVYLAGGVDTVFARTKAANLAGAVPGVVEVRNSLEVAQTHHLYRNGVAGGAYPDKTVRLNDAELGQAVTERLRSSVLVDAKRVNVYVDDGTVTLTGLVANETERQAAVHNAYAAGAKLVRDHLTLRPPEPVAQASTTPVQP